VTDSTTGARLIKAREVQTVSSPGLELAIGVSAETAGSKTLLFGRFKARPGSRVPPHHHTCETAAYLVSGRAVINVGEDLGERFEMEPGDYVYVGAGVIHDEETVGDEDAVLMMARDQQGGERIAVDPADPGWALLEG